MLWEHFYACKAIWLGQQRNLFQTHTQFISRKKKVDSRWNCWCLQHELLECYYKNNKYSPGCSFMKHNKTVAFLFIILIGVSIGVPIYTNLTRKDDSTFRVCIDDALFPVYENLLKDNYDRQCKICTWAKRRIWPPEVFETRYNLGGDTGFHYSWASANRMMGRLEQENMAYIEWCSVIKRSSCVLYKSDTNQFLSWCILMRTVRARQPIVAKRKRQYRR